MNQTNVHHRGWHVESFGADQLFHVLAVGALLCLLVFRTNPGINIEVEAADRGVPRRILLVREAGLAREIAFELHPVETSDIFCASESTNACNSQSAMP